MSYLFQFETDDEAYQFCVEIADLMVSLFGITTEEAVGRINRDWKDKPIIGDNNMLYHETADYFAKKIYYFKVSYWWLPEAKPIPRLYP